MINLNSFNTVELVEGNISHTRHIKPFNSFNYKCISIIVNLNKARNQKKIVPLFSINKSNIFSWNEKDHGDGEIHPLNWARNEVSKFGGDASGTVLLHCFPKIFGYVFNPLSVYFCFNKNNSLTALIYEVRNVVGGIHSYVAIVDKQGQTHLTKKLFEVSPFLSSDGVYKLRAIVSNNKLNISVNYFIDNSNILDAIQVGKISLLTTSSLFIAIIKGLAFPAKPMINILYESLKLIIKGAIFKKIDVMKKHKTNLAKKI
jgi:DUF1365 family protein